VWNKTISQGGVTGKENIFVQSRAAMKIFKGKRPRKEKGASTEKVQLKILKNPISKGRTSH